MCPGLECHQHAHKRFENWRPFFVFLEQEGLASPQDTAALEHWENSPYWRTNSSGLVLPTINHVKVVVTATTVSAKAYFGAFVST